MVVVSPHRMPHQLAVRVPANAPFLRARQRRPAVPTASYPPDDTNCSLHAERFIWPYAEGRTAQRGGAASQWNNDPATCTAKPSPTRPRRGDRRMSDLSPCKPGRGARAAGAGSTRYREVTAAAPHVGGGVSRGDYDHAFANSDPPPAGMNHAGPGQRWSGPDGIGRSRPPSVPTVASRRSPREGCLPPFSP